MDPIAEMKSVLLDGACCSGCREFRQTYDHYATCYECSRKSETMGNAHDYIIDLEKDNEALLLALSHCSDACKFCWHGAGFDNDCEKLFGKDRCDFVWCGRRRMNETLG